MVSDPLLEELIGDVLARQEAERLASQVDWHWAVKNLRPPREWLDGSDNPFEPDEGPSRYPC